MVEIAEVLNKVSDEILEQIVKMELAEISATQICTVAGLKLEEFEALKQSEIYTGLKQKLSMNEFLFNQNINDGWDCVERMALDQIHKKLQFGSDPNFALRAAMVANKANKKGMHEQKPLNGNGTNVAIISISKTFVNELNQKKIAPRAEVQKEIPKKQQDFLEPAKVQNMLTVLTDNEKGGAIDLQKVIDDELDELGDIIVSNA